MSKPLADFLPEVLPFVPGCPQPVAINAVRNSVIQFMTETGLSEQTLSVSLVDGTALYTVTPAAGTKIINYVRGDIAGSPVYPASPAQLDATSLGWRALDGSQPTQAFIEGGQLRVLPIPGAAATLSATFVCAPTRAATTVDDEVLEDYAETIASGALYRLLALPGQPWSSPELADYHKAKFEADVSDAIVMKMKGGTNASLSAKPRSFAGAPNGYSAGFNYS